MNQDDFPINDLSEQNSTVTKGRQRDLETHQYNIHNGQIKEQISRQMKKKKKSVTNMYFKKRVIINRFRYLKIIR